MFIKYAFVADKASIDTQGKFSALGIFDTIAALTFPARQREMTFAAYLEGSHSEKGKRKLSVELRDEDGNKLLAIDQEIELNPKSLKAGVLITFADIIFPKHGNYEVALFVDGRFLGRVTFSLHKIPAAGAN